jgi:hypothetical protein
MEDWGLLRVILVEAEQEVMGVQVAQAIVEVA